MPGTGRQPGADGGGVAPVDDAEDLSGGQVDQSRHPRLDPPPRAYLVAEETHRAVAVLIDPQAGDGDVVDVGRDHGRGGVRAVSTSHQDTRWARVTSAAARPQSTTAETTVSFNRWAERANRGTC